MPTEIDITPGETLSRSEIRTIVAAAKARWPLSEAMREDIVRELHTTATTAESERCRAVALKAIVDLDKLNMEQEKRDAIGFAEVHEHQHTGQVLLTPTTLRVASDELNAWREQMRATLPSSPSAPPTPPTSATPTG